jgi:WD40 repeat protein
MRSPIFLRPSLLVLFAAIFAAVPANWRLLAFEEQTSPATAPRIRDVAFSPDGKLLAASAGPTNGSGTVTVWELASQKVVWNHPEKVVIPSIAFAPDSMTLAIAVLDEYAKILDASTGKEQKSFRHPAAVHSVAFSPDGRLLATAARDNAIRIWDSAVVAEKITLKGHLDSIKGIQFSADGKFMLSASNKDGAKLWDVQSGLEKRKFGIEGRLYHTRCAAITPDCRWVLTGDNGTIGVWDFATGKLRARLSDTGAVNSLVYWSPAAKLAACYWSEIDIFEVNLADPTDNQRNQIEKLLVQLDDDSFDVREAASKELVSFGLLAEPTLRLAIKVSPSAEVRIRARHLCNEILTKPKTIFKGHTEEVLCLALASDGRTLASGSADGTVRLWDFASGKELAVLMPK